MTLNQNEYRKIAVDRNSETLVVAGDAHAHHHDTGVSILLFAQLVAIAFHLAGAIEDSKAKRQSYFVHAVGRAVNFGITVGASWLLWSSMPHGGHEGEGR